jgi:type II secretory pathway pseudopilin PulG
LLELLIVMSIIFIISSMLIPMMRAALLRAHVSAIATDAKILHGAFKQYFVDMNMYPNASDAPAFDLATFEPLVSAGYYDGRVAPKLVDEQADGYDSPDDRGLNQEFWLEMTLSYDPSIRFLVADSHDSPLGGGGTFDGIYLFRDGVLTPIGNVKE